MKLSTIIALVFITGCSSTRIDGNAGDEDAIDEGESEASPEITVAPGPPLEAACGPCDPITFGCDADRVCWCGECICPDGTVECPVEDGRFACTDIMTDMSNCGECDFQCIEADNLRCVAGECICMEGMCMDEHGTCSPEHCP